MKYQFDFITLPSNKTITTMIAIKIFNESKYPTPSYATAGSSGVDLYADIKEFILLKPLERKLITTGIRLEIPEWYEGQVRPRSGLSLKRGLTVHNAPGTVDASYRGIIGVIIVNISNENQSIEPGERIAQLVFAKVEEAKFVEVKNTEELSNTERDSGGFGSTGTK